MEHYNVGRLDEHVVDELGIFYRGLQQRHLTALASCPSGKLAKCSIDAEFYLWHWDYGRVLSGLEGKLGSSARLRSSSIQRAAKASAACASQVFEKIKMAADVGEIRDLCLAAPGQSELLPALLSTIQDQTIDQYSEERAGAECIASLSHLTAEALLNFGITGIVKSNDLTARMREAQRKLVDIGLGPQSLADFRHMASRPGCRLESLAPSLREYYSNVQAYLALLQLPTAFHSSLWQDLHSA
jgi:hypothetical protein